jgi:transposase
MKHNLGYKYCLEVSKQQKQLLFNHIFTHNQAFNILLSESAKQFQNNIQLKIENKEPQYLSTKEQDDIVKKILRNRKLKFNTKVVQQTRMEFNKDIQKTIKTFQVGKKSDKGMLKFKSSKSFNNQSFQTTKEQYKLLDSDSSRYKILRLFNNSFKVRWTRDFPENTEYKTITISFKDNKFYISFNIEFELDEKKTKSSKLFHKVNGDINKLSKKELKSLKSYAMDINVNNIDIGNKKFHKKFNIEYIKNDNLKKKYKKKLKLLQRKQSRRFETLKKRKSLKQVIKNMIKDDKNLTNKYKCIII